LAKVLSELFDEIFRVTFVEALNVVFSEASVKFLNIVRPSEPLRGTGAMPKAKTGIASSIIKENICRLMLLSTCMLS
jgi:hypothetical protein